MVAGVIYITFALLLATLGIMQLQPTVDVINETVLDVENISSMTRSTIGRELRGTIDSANVIRSRMDFNVSPTQFCPADPELKGSELARDILRYAQPIIARLFEFGDFSLALLDDAESALIILDRETSTINFEITGWKTALVIIPYVTIPGILMAGCILTWSIIQRRYFQSFISCFALPAFILLTLIAIIAAVGMGIAATMNADFCLPVRSQSLRRALSRSIHILTGTPWNLCLSSPLVPFCTGRYPRQSANCHLASNGGNELPTRRVRV
jgi:hypothetical protein